ncbi:DUF805 domain-containing protein [Rhodobacter sp. Har01]|uniref:DUF805 domain-containing protein n=1 Tax=Rhodobacter sp. Har01 TaxID=2883999 RepID=UPI001D0949FE|nr:DUF805 domain-containing protein [Rhodobacter sp. Har01]
MGPARAIRTGFAKSFQFSGRASRSEFWWLALAAVVLTGLASALDGIVWPRLTAHLWLNFGDETARMTAGVVVSPLAAMAAFACVMPVSAAMMRRLHDAGFSGRLALVPLVAVCLVIAVIALSVFAFPTTRAFQPIMICLLILGASLLLTVVWLSALSQPGPNLYSPLPPR